MKWWTQNLSFFLFKMNAMQNPNSLSVYVGYTTNLSASEFHGFFGACSVCIKAFKASECCVHKPFGYVTLAASLKYSLYWDFTLSSIISLLSHFLIFVRTPKTVSCCANKPKKKAKLCSNRLFVRRQFHPQMPGIIAWIAPPGLEYRKYNIEMLFVSCCHE